MTSAYSPDDSHRLPDPSSRSGSSTPGKGLKLLMYLAFALALTATIIMFFVDSEVWLTVAVISALWAAFIGAILVSRYSGVLGEERSRRQDQERRHRAELDRERSESQRREVQLENDYRHRLGAEHDKTLDAIRRELETMREQLSDLSGGDWNSEQVSLKARAERIIELERNVSRAGQAPATPEPATAATTPETAPQTTPENRTGGRRGGFSTGTFAAVRWSGADSEETTQIPMVVDTRSMDRPETDEPEKPAEEPKSPEPRPEAPAEPQPAPAPEPSRPRWSEQVEAHAHEKPSEPEEAPAATPAPGRRRRAEDVEPHGRRRADESDKGVTVAELMAQMKKNAR